MTKSDAITKAGTGWWKTATPKEIVAFQMFEPLLCMPFDDFHEAVEKVLGYPVFTHEFAFPELREACQKALEKEVEDEEGE